jgi:siroheme synthase-like protein
LTRPGGNELAVAFDAPTYPVNLVVDGRACLVVGGGSVAARKARGLRDAGGDVLVVATDVGDEVRDLGVPFEERPYRAGEAGAYWLVVTATNDPELNRMVKADGDAGRIWVNAADDPASCSFILPAVVRQGPVTVAIATDGRSPALAARLRAHVAEELGPEWALLAEWLSEARERLRAAGRSTESADWHQIVDWEMLETLREGRVDRAKERLEAWLSSSLA